MQVTFDLTPEDSWHWNLYYRRNKHSIRPVFLTAWLCTFGFVLVCLLFICGLDLIRHQPVSWTLLLYLPAVIWFAYKYIPPSKKRVISYYARDPNQFCNHVIAISPAWIEETTPLSQNKMAWLRLTSIEEDTNYFYLCVSRRGAHIIPKRAFSGPHEAEKFLNTAHRYWEAAKAWEVISAEDEAVWPPPPQMEQK